MIPSALTSIRSKLALLAGVPMLGALLLALFVANDARERAASAASLGSVEDLARLTSYITNVIHAVQDERAMTAAAEGLATSSRAGGVAAKMREATDASAARLEGFLATRDRSKLPPSLIRGVVLTETALQDLPAFRERLDTRDVELTEILTRYGTASAGLVGATAALAELSDDGALLRNISAIVALLELEERSSVEQAIVGYTAARREFPPGAFKALVTTTTEEAVYDQALRTSASDTVRANFESAREKGQAARTILNSVLTSTEDTVNVDSNLWSTSQGQAMTALREVEGMLLDRIAAVAAAKGTELRSAIRLSLGLAFLVTISSIAMAIFVRRGVQTSVNALTDAAARVRVSRDFSVRAKRVSNDELGMLTDTFNEMLAGMQSRDAELEQHRSHLEGLVVARTRQLGERNEAMRLVLDNVDQGLAMIDLEGKLQPERSAAFDRWFETPGVIPFPQALAASNDRLRLLLEIGWQQVADDFLPAEVSLDQIPKQFDIGSSHYTLAIKPVLDGTTITGALLVISDVTAELESLADQARQREDIRVFHHIARDRAGFTAFIEETGTLVEQLRHGHDLPAHDQLSLVHTVKGNAAQSELASVASAAHDVETFIVENGTPAGRAQLFPLLRAWDTVGLQVSTLLGDDVDSRVDVAPEELKHLVDEVKQGMPVDKIIARLEGFSNERVATRFARLADHADRLARRLGKPSPAITIETHDIRLPRGRYAALWTNLVHVVRNAIDHGVETPDARTSVGKSPNGKLAFRAHVDNGDAVLEIADDGAGVDWERVAAKARAAGVPSEQREDLNRALFTSGISTRDAVTDTSGRGVGLAAVWNTTVALGGSVKVTSEPGKGTQVVFRVPTKEVSSSPRLVEGEVG